MTIDPNRKKIGASQLKLTITELESAFQDWDSAKPGQPLPMQLSLSAEASGASSTMNDELKNKTRKLLMQLREQIAELSSCESETDEVVKPAASDDRSNA